MKRKVIIRATGNDAMHLEVSARAAAYDFFGHKNFMIEEIVARTCEVRTMTAKYYADIEVTEIMGDPMRCPPQ